MESDAVRTLGRACRFVNGTLVGGADLLVAEKQHPHALKHSIASHLVSANVNLALVKQQLGHKSINSTLRYVTTTDQQASRATATALKHAPFASVCRMIATAVIKT